MKNNVLVDISGTKRNGKLSNGKNLDIVVEKLLEMMVYMTGFCTKPNFKVLVISASRSWDNKVKSTIVALNS